MFIKFKDWLVIKEKAQNEMTTSAASSGGGGGTSTADIAGFARPFFSGGMVRRGKKAKKEDLPHVND